MQENYIMTTVIVNLRVLNTVTGQKKKERKIYTIL